MVTREELPPDAVVYLEYCGDQTCFASNRQQHLGIFHCVIYIPFLEDSEKKSGKLAWEDERRGGLLIAMPSDPDDSGIDSDDPARIAALARRRGNLPFQSENSSSDDEGIKPPWVRGKPKDEPIVHQPYHQLQQQPTPPEERDEEVQWRRGRRQFPVLDSSPERASPPLYEVELTASDEDDDASVLELVIPMQSSRYQRVPTSPPKKISSEPKYFCNLFCCVRK